MDEPAAYPDTADHDAVMSWLQDREMKDHALADARSGRVGVMGITSTIGRMQEKAYAAFPHLDRQLIDAFVRDYVDPLRRMREKHDL